MEQYQESVLQICKTRSLCDHTKVMEMDFSCSRQQKLLQQIFHYQVS